MSNSTRNTRKGHYCWSCDRHRRREAFSGKGHHNHVCRDCARLGPAELAFRQQVADLQRCLTPNGAVRRRSREIFETFLHHHDPRLRDMAAQHQQIDDRQLRRQNEDARADERAAEPSDEPTSTDARQGGPSMAFPFAPGGAE